MESTVPWEEYKDQSWCVSDLHRKIVPSIIIDQLLFYYIFFLFFMAENAIFPQSVLQQKYNNNLEEERGERNLSFICTKGPIGAQLCIQLYFNRVL